MNAISEVPIELESMPIALRGYAECEAFPPSNSKKPDLRPSKWTIIFDTETHIDAAQALRFGNYQVRDGERLHEAGIFYDPNALTAAEVELLQRVTAREKLVLRSVSEFIEKVFFKYGYEREGVIVGFNLPFDISRIAIRHASARGFMRGGFTFILSEHPWRARIQVKHLSARSAFIAFTVPGKQLQGKGMRNRGIRVSPHRGIFVDLKTLAAALTATSYTLATLGEFLRIEHPKLETDEHGGPLTQAYFGYAVRDVQATWECYRELRTRYHAHGLTMTAAHKIKSEAGLGKAYLREMGVMPWRQVQPDFPPELLGQIMSTYYGGRSEVHIRRRLVRVLYCDFLSMYPTVCTLMRLWRFVIVDGMTWRDSTEETRALLGAANLTDLQKPAFWPKLRTLVRILPQADVLPVRAQYGSEPQNTIGLNRLTSGEPIWFTLADCITSKLLSGAAPQIIEAVSFEPKSPQRGLRPASVGGNQAYRVNPSEEDFYRTVIDMRSEVKSRLKLAKAHAREGEAEQLETEQLETEQLAHKILANATSYGIFVEVNVEKLDVRETVRCFGMSGSSFPVLTAKRERPGTYFHPLLATLITGAARLMLAITERLALDVGLDWAFCDTDSMALARPDGMSDAEFVRRGQDVRGWFDELNPYSVKGELLKLEDANFSPDGSATEPLYCFAVSAKRYVLLSLDRAGRPVIRKASAHGLGHLMAPYPESEAPTSIPAPTVPLKEIGVERWQYDLWHQIVAAALACRPDRPDLDFHPALKLPAISRYAATTPELLAWFKGYNEGRPYCEQVRPFGFLTALQTRQHAHLTASDHQASPNGNQRRTRIRPVAPYHKDPLSAAAAAFDRETGAPVDARQCASYRETIAQYHLHPEGKFRNADFTDSGPTGRRHIQATEPIYIGKEADRLEKQYFLGLEEDAAVDYGSAPEGRAAAEKRVRDGIRRFGQQAAARAARMSLRDVSRAALEGAKVSLKQVLRLDRALANMEAAVDRLSQQPFGVSRRKGRP